MKAQMAGSGMNSTIQPRRARPRKRMMAPVMMARAEAMTWPGTPGSVSWALSTTLPVTWDMTATGCRGRSVGRSQGSGWMHQRLTPMVMSLDVAKNQ